MARLSREGARDRLSRCGISPVAPPSFFTLSQSRVGDLLALADDDGYRVPRNANGSRGRYYYARLVRAAQSQES